MATTANRQVKLPKKGIADSARFVLTIKYYSHGIALLIYIPTRRPPGSAWNGARASPTFSPGSTSPHLPNGPPAGSQGAFPPLGNRPQDNNPHERALQALTVS